MTRSPDSPAALAPGALAYAVREPGGQVVASGGSYALVAAALGFAADAAPAWADDVDARLAGGEPAVARTDPSCDGRLSIESEHVAIMGADGRPMVASRYRVGARKSEVRPPGAATERLADVLRMTAEWLYETDPGLVLTYVSDRVFDDIGALPAELVGEPLFELGVFDAGPSAFAEQLDPDLRRPFADRMADVRHASGKLRRVRFSGVPVFVDGAFAGYRGVARDETRQQSARDAAARAESRLTVGLAASRDGFAVFDADGLLVTANPQVAIDLGRREPLLPGMELGKLLNNALKTGWFVDTDAPSLAATRPSLSDPDGGQAMIEITLADGRRVLFCASRTECNDVLLISTDITAIGTAKRARRPSLRRSA